MTEEELAAAEARARDEFGVASARLERARNVLGRLQCRFSWEPEDARPGWSALWCGRPDGHDGTHDARFYLEENPCEDFAVAVAEYVLADRDAGIASQRWLDAISAVQWKEDPDDTWQEGELDRVMESKGLMESEDEMSSEDTEIVDLFDQYPLDGFWDPRWGSWLSETEEVVNQEQPPVDL
ncbi:hypothetical protein [Brevibacterium sp. UCMA 11754]|uniref:hypothetical protein n=1 Tax=Brevibacterium sp. UCMA 11754 TaxID=2749198 RepID=UPI001F185671|nr:hypothetical protein [Brevibacterium sp. UCMA 11754]MCF2571102.1 hypothetical protein [Brevibacterium sp. UCMA 11754]